MNIDNIATLEEAKEAILQMISGDGGSCPCCRQKVRAWRKSICSTSAADMIRLVRAYRGVPLHYDTFCVLPKDRNFSQLVLWDLIEPGDNKDDKKNASGTWSPSLLGIDWVFNLAEMPKYITTYDNKIIRKSTKMIGIKKALNNKFDYAALIAAQEAA